MTLRVPKEVRREWKATRPVKTAMAYGHAASIVAEGLSRETRRHRSVALGVAAQFEFTLRQIDVIGEWEKFDGVVDTDAETIVCRGRIWRPGLRFEDLASGTLDLTTSKNETTAAFDVAAYPLFQQA